MCVVISVKMKITSSRMLTSDLGGLREARFPSCLLKQGNLYSKQVVCSVSWVQVACTVSIIIL